MGAASTGEVTMALQFLVMGQATVRAAPGTVAVSRTTFLANAVAPRERVRTSATRIAPYTGGTPATQDTGVFEP
jgi:hypothetical protein